MGDKILILEMAPNRDHRHPKLSSKYKVEKRIKGRCHILESVTDLQEIKEILAGIRGTKIGAAS